MLQLGVIGTGIFAKNSHFPAIQQTDGLEVGGVFNRTLKKAEDFAEFVAKEGEEKPLVFEDVDSLINHPEIDVIDILLPVQYNLEMVTKAVKAGKPVAFEKPIAASLEDARKIVNLAESTEVPVMVLENWLYHKRTKQISDLLPEIGRVILFTYEATGAFHMTPYHGTSWRQKPEHAGGFLSDSGVHDFGLITQVLGNVKSVSAHSTQLRPESGAQDTLASQLMLQSGAFGTYTQGRYLGATKAGIQFHIFGTEGSLLLEAYRSGSKLTFFKGTGAGNSQSRDINLEPEEINGVVPEFANFADVLLSKDKSKIFSTPAKAFHHYAVVVALVESAAEGGKVVEVERL